MTTALTVVVAGWSAAIAGRPSVVDGVAPQFHDLTLTVANSSGVTWYLPATPQHLHYDDASRTLSVHFHRQAVPAPGPGHLTRLLEVPVQAIGPGETASVVARLPAQLMVPGDGPGLAPAWHRQDIARFAHLTVEIEASEHAEAVTRRSRASDAPGSDSGGPDSGGHASVRRILVHVARHAIPATAPSADQP